MLRYIEISMLGIYILKLIRFIGFRRNKMLS